LIPLDPARLARFSLELVVLIGCFVIIARQKEAADKAAAWAIIGLVVASVIRNLADQ
jgi:hypothetical protein